jgi:hypothetical protein
MTTRVLCRALLCLLLLGGASFAEEESTGAPDDAAELAKKLNNPIADLISVPFQNNWDFHIGPAHAMRYYVNVQPVIPFSLTQDWNLITRTILPIIHAEPPVDGAETLNGMGDSRILSPKDGRRWIVAPGRRSTIRRRRKPARRAEGAEADRRPAAEVRRPIASSRTTSGRSPATAKIT